MRKMNDRRNQRHYAYPQRQQQRRPAVLPVRIALLQLTLLSTLIQFGMAFVPTTTRKVSSITTTSFPTSVVAPLARVKQERGMPFVVAAAASKLPMVDAEVVLSSQQKQQQEAKTMSTNSLLTTNSNNINNNKKKKSTDPSPVLVSWWQQQQQNHMNENSSLALSQQTGTKMFATLALTLALLLLPPQASWAASTGGRMGGSFSSPSRSFSSPSFRGGGGAFSSPGMSRSYYYSRPSVTITTPFYNPFFSPFPQPYVFGGPGVIAYSRGPSFFDLLLIGGMIFAISTLVRNVAETATSESNGGLPWTESSSSVLGPGTSVVQLSVALDVANRDEANSILCVLQRLATTAQTDSRVGIQNLTSQVALELLRRKSSIVSASTQYQHYSDRSRAQREFQRRAIQERGKFEQETRSNYGGVDYYSSSSSGNTMATPRADAPQATMAVVTLLLAIDGDSTKIPSTIRSITDVEEALRLIAANAKVDDCLQSCEILWTPEDRTETLTLRDVIADYPDLRVI